MPEQLTGLLRRLVREAEGRGAEPSACVPDSQAIKTSVNVPLADQGTDAGNRITGRTCHLGCDTLGLLLTVPDIAASVSDTAAGVTLLSRLDVDVHPVQRQPGARGFTIIPRRWTIERSIGRAHAPPAPRPRLTRPTRTAPKP